MGGGGDGGRGGGSSVDVTLLKIFSPIIPPGGPKNGSNHYMSNALILDDLSFRVHSGRE